MAIHTEEEASSSINRVIHTLYRISDNYYGGDNLHQEDFMEALELLVELSQFCFPDEEEEGI